MFEKRYKNLVIIGNGFDRWQDLPTSYEQFRQYYFANVDKVLSDMGFQKYTIIDDEGNEKTVTAVEMVYGDPFNPDRLPDKFFWEFEVSLDKIDDQQLNYFFGRSKNGVAELNRIIIEAQQILRALFCEWIANLDVSKSNPAFRFPKDCYFINFNYTDTLEKRFGIRREDICHIHGSAEEPDSIIVGHSSHPETAFKELVEQQFMKAVLPGGLPRFKGLYAIEDILYKTDKHVEDNIDNLCAEMMRRGVHIEDIENIYVLGHSFGEPDFRYFEYLDRVTRCGCDYDSLSATGRLDLATLALISYGGDELAEELLMDMIQLNIQYAIHHRDRVFADAPSLYPELDKIDEEKGMVYSAIDAAKAVEQRFLYEQAGRTKKVLDKLAVEKGMKTVPEGCHSVFGLADYVDMGHEQRRRNATWHISYFTPEDEKRIKRFMKRLGQKRYTLYQGIDKCISGLIG